MATPDLQLQSSVEKLHCLLNKDRFQESRNLYVTIGVCLVLAGAIMSGLHIKDLLKCFSNDEPEEYRLQRSRNLLCLLAYLFLLVAGIVMCHKGQCVAQRLIKNCLSKE